MPDHPILLDTSYVFAPINPNDQWHAAATRLQARIKAEGKKIVTTEFVLTKIGDGLSALRFRKAASFVINLLLESPEIEIIPATDELFRRALELFDNRQDKSWGLTDCSSFVVMDDLGISEALTTGDDFSQAGFTALMLQ